MQILSGDFLLKVSIQESRKTQTRFTKISRDDPNIIWQEDANFWIIKSHRIDTIIYCIQFRILIWHFLLNYIFDSTASPVTGWNFFIFYMTLRPMIWEYSIRKKMIRTLSLFTVLEKFSWFLLSILHSGQKIVAYFSF